MSYYIYVEFPLFPSSYFVSPTSPELQKTPPTLKTKRIDKADLGHAAAKCIYAASQPIAVLFRQ
jgi:hypothetical protein